MDVAKKLAVLNFSNIKILGQNLGKGAYGEVYTVKYGRETFAAKEIHQILQDGAQSIKDKRILKNKFLYECYQCSVLAAHPNIIRTIGVFYKSQPFEFVLPVMIMEMMDESLTVYIERLPRDAVKRKGPILLDVAEGLKYLHSRKPPIVHRDLSPNNIMLVKGPDGETTTAKIGDLGVAKAISPDGKHMQNMGKLTKIPGTLDFMPPEVFHDSPDYDTSLDVFSYGAVMLFVATHEWPVPDSPTKPDPTSPNEVIGLNEVERRKKYLDQMTDEMKMLKPLVERCLSYKRNDRPTIVEVSEELKSLKSEGILFVIPAPGGTILDNINVSSGSIQKRQYSIGTQPFDDDDNNEVQHIVHSNKCSLCMCVFDGHDGSQAVQFAKNYMEQVFRQEWDIVTNSSMPEGIEATLAKYIEECDDSFFESIEPFICEKEKIQLEIPKELNSHEAQQMYPDQVARLQVLESHISGGCTAVVAVIISNRLYVANVGDSRAILAYEERGGPLQVKQLSEDHGVENEQELQRLMALGLDREQLKKSGRLGTQENTRSIGDYSIKGGYKDTEMLWDATDQPGTAEPHVISVNIDYTFKYIILMSDGVYKTLKAIDGGDTCTNKSGNEIIVDMIEKVVTEKGWNAAVAKNVLREICQTQYDLYASEDANSPMAVANRKRDDMTLVIYKVKFETGV